MPFLRVKKFSHRFARKQLSLTGLEVNIRSFVTGHLQFSFCTASSSNKCIQASTESSVGLFRKSEELQHSSCYICTRGQTRPSHARDVDRYLQNLISRLSITYMNMMAYSIRNSPSYSIENLKLLRWTTS